MVPKRIIKNSATDVSIANTPATDGFDRSTRMHLFELMARSRFTVRVLPDPTWEVEPALRKLPPPAVVDQGQP